MAKFVAPTQYDMYGCYGLAQKAQHRMLQAEGTLASSYIASKL